MQLVFCSDMVKTSYWSYFKQTLFSVLANDFSRNAASYSIQIGGWALLHLASFGFRCPCFLSMGNRLKPCKFWPYLITI